MNEIFTIYDKKSATYGGLYQFPNKDVATRAFASQEFAQANSLVIQYPEDFDIYSLGTFNIDTGVVVSQVVFVSNFKEVLKHD